MCITEVLADNRTGLREADGLASDWIELCNVSEKAVSLAGYQLKCADGSVFTIPEVELAAHEYLLVFASGKDRASSTRALHTPFRLSRRGETLQLLAKDGALVSELTFSVRSSRTCRAVASRMRKLTNGSRARRWGRCTC